jgi:hypothetical protein
MPTSRHARGCAVIGGPLSGGVRSAAEPAKFGTAWEGHFVPGLSIVRRGKKHNARQVAPESSQGAPEVLPARHLSRQSFRGAGGKPSCTVHAMLCSRRWMRTLPYGW